jgi:hypothetical protein
MGEPTSPEDETPPPPDDSVPEASDEEPAETPPASAETEYFRPDEDETTRLTPEDLVRPGAVNPAEPGGTVIMPSGSEAPAWSGRAEVPVPPVVPGGLRDSAPHQPGEPPPPRTWWTPVLLGMIALGLVGIVVLAAWLINRNSTPAPKPTPTSTPAPQPSITTAPTTAAPPTASPTATVQLVQVPGDIVGMTQDDATAALDKVGLAYSLEFQESDKPKGTVISSSPAPGKLVPAQSTVKLLISLGSESPSASPTP